VKDAESHASEDEDRKKKVEARNTLDSLVYQVEKDSKEWGEKVAATEKERLEKAVEAGKEALKGDDAARMNQARDELMQAFSAAGQQVYQAQAAEAPAEPGPETAAPKEEADVVEADYEIVEDEKN
jgi:molecular chaperone DnaK